MNNRGKKELVLVLSALLLLPGCHGEIGSERMAGRELLDEQEITISWWGDEGRNEYMQRVLDQYEQLHTEIRFCPIRLGETEYEKYLVVKAAAGECPDIMLMDDELLGIFAKNGTLADCKELLAREDRETCVSGYEHFCTSGRKAGIQAGISVPYAMLSAADRSEESLYFSISALLTQEEQETAADFLAWFMESEMEHAADDETGGIE